MIKLFLKDSFLYTVSNLLTKGIGFLMLPIYTSFFNPAKFGVLDILLVTGNILSVIIGLEIHQAVARFFPEAETFEEKRKIVSTSFWAILFFYILFLLPSSILAPFIADKFLKNSEYSNVVLLALISYGFNFLYYFASAQLKWQLKAKENFIVSAIYSVCTALFSIVFLRTYGDSLGVIFVAQIIGATVGLLASIYFAKEYYSLIFEKAIFKKLTKFSIPLIFSTLTVYAMLYVDRIIINYFLKSEDLGLYAFGYRVASVIGLLTVGTQTALTPLIYTRFKESETPKHIAKLFHLFLGASVLIVAGLFVLSPFAVKLLASVDYSGSSMLIPWIALSILFTGMINFTPGIFIASRTHIILYINIASFVLNLILSFVLVKTVGLVGAVLATAICSLFYFLMYYYIGQKHYFIPFFWSKKQGD